uniref:PX domain-containing protein n=1 Tax=Romanomermis culicivorax TaxID=13658 RepID=A0A915HPD0_ROMCU
PTGTLELYVVCTEVDLISNVKAGFSRYFPNLIVRGVPPAFASNVASQPVGYESGLNAVKEAVKSVQNSGLVAPNSLILAFNSFLVNPYADNWLEFYCVALNNGSNVDLQTFTQPVTVPSFVLDILKNQTATDYPLASTGFACNVDEVMSRSHGLTIASWHQQYAGLSKAELIGFACVTLAYHYRTMTDLMEDVPIHSSEPKGLFDDSDDEDLKITAEQKSIANDLKNLNDKIFEAAGDTDGQTNGENVESPKPAQMIATEQDQEQKEKAVMTPDVPPTPPIITPISSTSSSSITLKNEEDKETVDLSMKLQIDINGYDKRGEGMQSYYVYKVVTKPVVGRSMGFTKKEYDVWRRFSDFLGLHDKLVEKHLPNGILIPSAPEKDAIGTTKTKMTKAAEEDAVASEFLERRRAMLERFLRRCSLHPTILLDPDFRDFLTLETDLPKSSQTAALSGSGVMRFLGKVGSSLTKMNLRIEENDTWFQDKQEEIEDLEEQLKKLHDAFETLIFNRRESSNSIDSFCKALSLLAACEDNTSLSKALSVLSESMEKIGAVHLDQAEKDLYLMAEQLKDYLGLILSIKDIFQERIKCWQAWQTAQLNLTRKRESKVRMEISGKTDRMSQVKKEIQECEAKVQECEESFEKIGRIIKRELNRFDAQRIYDFKIMMIHYMESLADSQAKVVKCWETFLPDAKGIIC